MSERSNEGNFSVEDALHQTMGDKELLAHLAQLYLAKVDGIVEKIDALLEANDMDEAAIAVHSFKGTFAAFGKCPAFFLAREVELALKNQQYKKALEAYPEVKKIAFEMKVILQDFVASVS